MVAVVKPNQPVNQLADYLIGFNCLTFISMISIMTFRGVPIKMWGYFYPNNTPDNPDVKVPPGPTLTIKQKKPLKIRGSHTASALAVY
jgi:hypothetical protein